MRSTTCGAVSHRCLAVDVSGFINNVVTAKPKPVQTQSSSDSSSDDKALAVQLPSGVKSELEVSLPEEKNVSHTAFEPVQGATTTTAPKQEKVGPETESVPALVVERVDNKPIHGDDFGSHATAAQKLAHEIRAADATPDEVVINPVEPIVDLGTLQPDAQSEEPTPLFKHESFDAKDRKDVASEPHPLPNSPLVDPTEALSKGNKLGPVIQVTAERSGLNDQKEEHSKEHDNPSLLPHEGSPIDKTSPPLDQVDQFPLLPHETAYDERHFERRDSELDQSPLLPHETGFEEQHLRRNSELDQSPLLPHETGFMEQQHARRDSGLDQSPLLPHETGFVEPNGFRPRSNSELDQSPLLPHEIGLVEPNKFRPRSDSELDQSPLLPHETGYEQYADISDDLGVPLLPHERSSFSSQDGLGPQISVSESKSPRIVQESGSHWSPDRVRRTQFFVRRTTGQPLPSSLAASAVRDDDPNDPSLEPFPTARNEILERVATISHRLPEDETIDAATVHSPAISQACSSTDNLMGEHHLSSYLNPLVEDEEEEVSDVDDLPELRPPEPKPLASGFRTNDSFFPATTVGIVEKAMAEDNMKTPRAEYPPGFQHTVRDFATPNVVHNAQDSQTSSSRSIEPLTPPQTPDRKRKVNKQSSVPEEISRTSVEVETPPAKTALDTDKKPAPEAEKIDDDSKAPAKSHEVGIVQISQTGEGTLKWLFRVLFESWMGPLKRFIGSVCGGNREAR